MIRAILASLFVAPVLSAQVADAGAIYWPAKGGDWESIAPEEIGMSPDRLAAAVAFAEQQFDRDGGFEAFALGVVDGFV